MRKNLQPFLLAAALTVSFFSFAANAQDEYHQFSNKDGQKIEAKIVSVTPDKKLMKIQRRDGAEFEMAINVLSLDDQLAVRKWIQANPNGAKVDYNLDVSIEKKAKTTANDRDNYYKYKTSDVPYEITIKNKSREALVNARVDYVAVMEDSLRIYRTPSGRPEMYDDDVSGKKYVRKSVKLPESLAFNFAHTFLTEPLKHEEVTGDGNITYGEDEIQGVILRVMGPGEAVLGEYRSGESYIGDVTWDQVKGSAFASVAANPAGPTPETPAPATAASTSREIPEWLKVRELESLPELLQKGDTIKTPNLPRWGQKEVRFVAHVDIDEDRTGGTIVSCGGQNKGVSLFVLNDALHFWVGKLLENEVQTDINIKIPLSDLPKGEFKVAAEFLPDTLKMWIDDELKAEGDSFGLITYRPMEGLSVGYDSERGAVGPMPAPHPFIGKIRDVQVKFGGSSSE